MPFSGGSSSGTGSNPLPPSSSSNSSQSAPLTPAAPPSRSEVERKLSFKSAHSPRMDQSPRKKRSPSTVSGNDSDTSLSSAQGGHSGSVGSPLLSPSLSSGPGVSVGTVPAPALANRQLSAIAERLSRGQNGAVEEVEEYEEHDEGEDLSDEEMDNAESRAGQGELERGMEGERVLRSGYLYKKQEKRKVWKKKWFVLRTGKLAYYKDDREYSLSRVIDLHIIHTAAPVKIKKHSFTFGIVTKKRTFLVEASSQSEMDEWVAAISTARRKLTEDAEKRGNPGSASVRQVSGPGQALEGGGSGGIGEYSAGGVGTPNINTASYFTRNAGSVNSSPAQMYPSSGLPNSAATPGTENPSSQGLISQMARMSTTSGVGIGHQSQPVGMGSRQPSSGPPTQPVRSFSRREPSASSISSAGADYFPRTPSASQSPQPPLSQSVGRSAGQGISSDSDEVDQFGQGEEVYFSDVRSQLGTSVGTTKTGLSLGTTGSQGGGGGMGGVDPARIILSAYLMKRSKGRGRKVWRKRWFYLTSQGLTYTKSHMDTKTLRNIPLSSILDAIDQSSTLDDVDPSSSDSDTPTTRPGRSPSTSKFSSPPAIQRQLSTRGSTSTSTAFGSGFGGPSPKEGEHTFRLVTAKRNYVLCAPSEEDEIKWLAAVKALLNRERGLSSPVNEMPPRLAYPPTVGGVSGGGGGGYSPSTQGQGQGWGGVPTITQQPPTPGQIGQAQGLAPPLPTEVTGTTIPARQTQPTSPGNIGSRGRSATYLAKSAVADVERRFHPESQQQQQQQQPSQV